MRVSVASLTVSVKQITHGGPSSPSESSHDRVGVNYKPAPDRKRAKPPVRATARFQTRDTIILEALKTEFLQIMRTE